MSGWAVLLLTSLAFPQGPSTPAAPPGVAPSSSASSDNADTQKAVARKIRELDDDLLKVREASEQALIAMGPRILPLLPDAGTVRSPEVRERLTRVRRELELALVRQAFGASTVNLQSDMALAQALEEIQSQTKNQFLLDPDCSGIVKALGPDEPFWSALDQILDATSCTVDLYSSQDKTLKIVPRVVPSLRRYGRAGYEGPFRFEPMQTVGVRDLQRDGDGSLRVRLAVCWEPRVTPISLAFPLKELRATDDQGRPVVAPIPAGSLTASVEGDMPLTHVDLPLPLPDRAARSLKSLQGTMLATMAGPLETFTFKRLVGTKNVEQRRAGVTVTLKDIRKNEDVYEFRVSCRYEDSANALESHRGWMFRNDAYLLDSDGHRVEQGGYQSLQRRESEFAIAYMFVIDRPVSSYSFVYKTPALLLSQEIKFELQNIALP